MHVVNRPLFDGARRQDPKRIVVHAMGEYIRYKGRDLSAWELLKKRGLSAHCLVTPSGVLVRCRKDDQGAFHARGNNTDTLGVEVLVPGVHDLASFYAAIEQPGWVTDEAFATTIEVVSRWCRAYDITTDDVVRHSTIDPARKKDPGAGFPWATFLLGVKANL